MTVADKLRVEHRRAPCACRRRRRRMRRAHDPPGLSRRGLWLGRDPQHQAGHSRQLRGQRQPAAGDEIELPRLAPDFQHHDAKRIAGERVGCRPQRTVDVRRTHRHQSAGIQAQFGQAAHRQRAGFDFGKILTDPHQRPPGARPLRQACDKTRRRSTLPACRGEHFMDRSHSEATLQGRIRIDMPERHPGWRSGIAIRLDAPDAATQRRKRAGACAAHAPLLQGVGPSQVV
jgi:hypothetical protein